MNYQNNITRFVAEASLINKKQGFSQIENCILGNRLISGRAKNVYAILILHDNTERGCFPGQDRIAFELNCSVDTVQRALDELKRLGLLSWKQTGLNKPNQYTIEEIPVQIKDTYHDQLLCMKLKRTATKEESKIFESNVINSWQKKWEKWMFLNWKPHRCGIKKPHGCGTNNIKTNHIKILLPISVKCA